MNNFLLSLLVLGLFSGCAKESGGELEEPLGDELATEGYEQKEGDELDAEQLSSELDNPELTELPSEPLEQEAVEESVATEDNAVVEQGISDYPAEDTLQESVIHDLADADESPSSGEPTGMAAEDPAAIATLDSEEAALDSFAGENTPPLLGQDQASDDGAELGAAMESHKPFSEPVLPSDKRGRYVVQPGDTLGRIAQKVFGTKGKWKELAEENKLENPDLIFPGDVIHFDMNQYATKYLKSVEGQPKNFVKVAPGDSLYKIAGKLFGNPNHWKPVWQLNADRIPNPDRILVGQVIYYYAENTAEGKKAKESHQVH